MDSSLENNKVMYLDLTHKLNDYNEIASVNRHLKDAYSSELDRLNYTNNVLRTRILRMKQEYMMNDHGVQEFRFRTNILYFTGFIVSIVLAVSALFMQGRIDTRMTMIIAFGLLIVYLIIVLIAVKYNIERRKNSYNQYYWNPVNKQK